MAQYLGDSIQSWFKPVIPTKFPKISVSSYAFYKKVIIHNTVAEWGGWTQAENVGLIPQSDVVIYGHIVLGNTTTQGTRHGIIHRRGDYRYNHPSQWPWLSYFAKPGCRHCSEAV